MGGSLRGVVRENVIGLLFYLWLSDFFMNGLKRTCDRLKRTIF